VVHLGEGEWMIVDSCLDDDGEPAALRYLDSLGVDVAHSVVKVAATHWHDDHVAGLGQVVRACDSAEFCCSAALRPQEFLALVEALAERSMTRRSGVSEFASVIHQLKLRKADGARFPTPQLASQDRTLWRRDAGPVRLQGRVSSLSPSDGAMVLAQRALASELPEAGQPKRAVAPPEENHTSVVLWVQIGEAVALLGADLEETARENTGWTVIVDRAETPGGPASVFKVPHHGSHTGHQRRVWEELLRPNAFAVLAPFAQGGTKLPAAADLDRICGYTQNAWTTSAARRQRQQRSRAVERTIKDAGVRLANADAPMGQVRLRCPSAGTAWTVELFGPAGALCESPGGQSPKKRRRKRRSTSRRQR